MLSGPVPRIYERWWRPALGRIFKGVLGPGMADEHRIARLLLALSPGDGVLDVACGTGNFSRDFARTVGPDRPRRGIDVSETMLARAVEDTAGGLRNVAYVRGDAQELPFLDKSFDAVCCFAALHLFADPMRALDRMTEVLTPGGRIAIFTTRAAPDGAAPDGRVAARAAQRCAALRAGRAGGRPYGPRLRGRAPAGGRHHAVRRRSPSVISSSNLGTWHGSSASW